MELLLISKALEEGLPWRGSGGLEGRALWIWAHTQRVFCKPASSGCQLITACVLVVLFALSFSTQLCCGLHLPIAAMGHFFSPNNLFLLKAATHMDG